MKNRRWYMAGLLMLATTICYLDRQALAIASVVIIPEFHMTKANYAMILMAYQLTYGFSQPFAGRLIDWINTRRGLTISVAAWSAVSTAHALGHGVFSFSILRGLLGITESGNFPGAAKAVSEWFPAKERAFATGVFNCGAGIGAIIAPPLLGLWLIPHYGWRIAFLSTGAIGMVWVVLWLLLYHAPEAHPRITKEELVYIRSGQEQEPVSGAQADRSVWREVLTRRDFWALGIGRFLSDPVWWFYLGWLPLYFKDVRHWNLATIGLFAWVPFLSADFGSLAGGALSSYLIKRGYSVITARKIAMCIFACLMPAAIPAVRASNPLMAIFFISIATFGHQSWAANMLSLPADLFPKRMVACTSGLTGAAQTVGSLLFTWYVGWVVMHHGYTPAFVAAGLMHPLAAIVVVTLLKSRKTVPPAAPAMAEAG